MAVQLPALAPLPLLQLVIQRLRKALVQPLQQPVTVQMRARELQQRRRQRQQQLVPAAASALAAVRAVQAVALLVLAAR